MLTQTIISILVLIIISIQTETTSLQDTLSCLDTYMESLRNKMNPKLFQMFKKSYPNTLSTTIQHYNLTSGQQQTYIITGDIEAMWLRDSTNQFLPYMKIQVQCPKIRSLAKGLINTQSEFIMIDPYTNAFKKYQKSKTQRHFYLNDKTQILTFGIPVDLCRQKQFVTESIWERKYEIDSLASYLRLAYEYTKKYKSIDFVNLKFIKAIKRLLTTIEEQSKDLSYEKKNKKMFYTFNRDPKELEGSQIKPSFYTGMIKSGFKPSDQPNTLAYNIPGNAMLASYLKLVATTVLDQILDHSVFKSEAIILSLKMKRFANNIQQSIFKYGVVNYQNMKIFSYEIDGKGQHANFDDANLPSLLSLPYLQFIGNDNQIYINTRKFILSSANKFYYDNGRIKGVGSSHTQQGYIWPLGLITQILTSNNSNQIKNCLNSLVLHSIDNLIHESFSIQNPNANTRAWFAWANSLFGQMIIKLTNSMPDVLK